MVQTQNRMALRGAGAAGAGPANQQAPIVADDAWKIIEKGVRVDPTFTITIVARQTIRMTARDVEAEIECNGITLKFPHEELIIDPRYGTAVLRRGGGLVAVSNEVQYMGEIYEAEDFAELIKRRVKELIEEAAATLLENAEAP